MATPCNPSNFMVFYLRWLAIIHIKQFHCLHPNYSFVSSIFMATISPSAFSVSFSSNTNNPSCFSEHWWRGWIFFSASNAKPLDFHSISFGQDIWRHPRVLSVGTFLSPSFHRVVVARDDEWVLECECPIEDPWKSWAYPNSNCPNCYYDPNPNPPGYGWYKTNSLPYSFLQNKPSII